MKKIILTLFTIASLSLAAQDIYITNQTTDPFEIQSDNSCGYNKYVSGNSTMLVNPAVPPASWTGVFLGIGTAQSGVIVFGAGGGTGPTAIWDNCAGITTGSVGPYTFTVSYSGSDTYIVIF